MLPLFVAFAVAVACCLCLSLAAASCQVFKSLGGSQTVVPPRLELGLGSVGPVSLSPSLSLLEWHLISMMSLFHLQLKNYAKCNRSRGQRQRKRQAQAEIASERCFCQQWKGISGLYTCMYRWYTSTFNTHKYLSDFALE